MIILYILYQISLLIFSFLSFSCYPTLDYDDTCGSEGSLGVCKNITNCPTAHTALIQRKRHGLERCGFHGIVEVVCCPDYKESAKVTEKTDGIGIWGRLGPPTPSPPATPTPTPTTLAPTDELTPRAERKSEAACTEYASQVAPGINYHILGGENASLGEFPHMAQIGFENPDITDDLSWDCGGALISDRFVLTAAHCTYKTDGTFPIRVRLGIVDMKNTKVVIPQEFGILNFHVHDEYARRSKVNDIALIELDGQVVRNINVQPACLYQNDDNPEGLIITGWGYTETGGEQSTILQKAQIHAVEVAECSKVYERRLSKAITSLQICCVSDDGTKDTCQGDSGGPLQVQISPDSNIYTLVGVTSFGMGCGGTTPGVYTRVSSYLDWVERIVWP